MVKNRTTRDVANDREQLVEHLQIALDLCEGSKMPNLAYLIARALDEVRAPDSNRASVGPSKRH